MATDNAVLATPGQPTIVPPLDTHVIKQNALFARWVPPLVLDRGGDDNVTITFECSNYVTLAWDVAVRSDKHQDLATGDGDTAYNRPQVFTFSPAALPTARHVKWKLVADYPGDEGRGFFARVTVRQHDFAWVSECTYTMPASQHVLVLTREPEFIAIGVPV